MSLSVTSREAETRLPGDQDVWIFILAELAMFGIFFIAYIVNRVSEVDLFNASQLELDQWTGMINTLVLITSSWLVVSALDAARNRRAVSAEWYLNGAISLGIAFVVIKYFEYASKLGAGITITTDTFFMFYFCLTGIHLLHVIAGTVILVVLRFNTRRGRYTVGNTKGFEAGATYWHMVDLLWIFLFALLYLLR